MTLLHFYHVFCSFKDLCWDLSKEMLQLLDLQLELMKRFGLQCFLFFRWTHKSSCDIRIISGKEGDIPEAGVVRDLSVLGCYLRSRGGERFSACILPERGRGCQQCGPWLHQGRRAWSWDCGHLRAGVHRFLCHRRQAQCPRFPCPGELKLCLVNLHHSPQSLELATPLSY